MFINPSPSGRRLGEGRRLPSMFLANSTLSRRSISLALIERRPLPVGEAGLLRPVTRFKWRDASQLFEQFSFGITQLLRYRDPQPYVVVSTSAAAHIEAAVCKTDPLA